MPDSERFEATEYLSKSHRVNRGRRGRPVCKLDALRRHLAPGSPAVEKDHERIDVRTKAQPKRVTLNQRTVNRISLLTSDLRSDDLFSIFFS